MEFPSQQVWAHASVPGEQEIFDFNQYENDYHQSLMMHGHSSSGSEYSPVPSLTGDDSGRSSPDYSTGPSTPEGHAVSPVGRKVRTKQDREKTTKMRDSGACIRCRIRKVNCEPDVCSECSKFCPDESLRRHVCIHSGFRDIGTMTSLLQPPATRTRSDGVCQQAFNLSVNLDNLAYLELNVIQQAHADGTTSLRLGSDSTHSRVLPSNMTNWARSALANDPTEPFRDACTNFLNCCLTSSTAFARSDLMDAVMTLVCMWRIYRTPAFYSSLAPHPELDDQIRFTAFRTMKSAEEKVWAILEDWLNSSKSKSSNDSQRPILFVCLWTLMFLYGDISKAMEMHHPAIILSNPSKLRHTIPQLYCALVVFYSGYFYMPQKLEPKFDASSLPVDGTTKELLSGYFAAVLETRKAWLEAQDCSMVSGTADFYLHKLVVEHEQHKLTKRSRKRKEYAKIPLQMVQPEYPVADYNMAGMEYQMGAYGSYPLMQ